MPQRDLRAQPNSVLAMMARIVFNAKARRSAKAQGEQV
jgi:hypothetical protein